MTDYTVSTAVSISKAFASITTSCPYVTATLLGSESDYADALTTCTGCADLDGYKITVITSLYSAAFTTWGTTTSIDNLGGCLATATTASAVCVTQSVYTTVTGTCSGGDGSTAGSCDQTANAGTTAGTDCSATATTSTTAAVVAHTAGTTTACSWTPTTFQMGGGVVSWSNTTNFAAAVTTAGSSLITGTALTVASHYVAISTSCTASAYDAATTTCNFDATTANINPTTTASTSAVDTVTYSWYQPDEDSDGYTTTMPRFSAEDDTVHWYGFDNAAAGFSYALTDCGSGILMGASTLLAGAAVAFGAAALAF